MFKKKKGKDNLAADIIKIEKFKPRENPYYMLKSRYYKTAKMIVLLLFTVYLLSMTAVFRDDITVENFKYLLKDIEFKRYSDDSGYKRIAYDSDSNADFAMYKGDFAVANSTGLKLYDISGSRTLTSEAVFSNPVMLTGSKYLLIYGLSEYNYSIYNNFGELFSETYDYPITNACLTDGGNYAIVTRDAEYRSIIRVYNSSFWKTSTVYKDKYIIDVNINDEKEELLILSMYAKEGDFVTELALSALGMDSEKKVLTYNSLMPIEAYYNSDGSFTMICDSQAVFFDSYGNEVKVVEFGKMIPLAVSHGDEYTLIAYNSNLVDSTCIIHVYNKQGEKIYDTTEKGNIISVKYHEKGFYMLIGSKAILIDLEKNNKNFINTDKNAVNLLIINNKSFFVCYPTSASVYLVSDMTEPE